MAVANTPASVPEMMVNAHPGTVLLRPYRWRSVGKRGIMIGMSTPKDIVRDFLLHVRSGREVERVSQYMADTVIAHQIQSEHRLTVERSPEQYAEHVREMIAAYGEFGLTVDELLADGDRVYARWTQEGHHVGEVDGVAPTGRPVTEIAGAVYRVANGLIVEYWIQIDRQGITAQLRAGA